MDVHEDLNLALVFGSTNNNLLACVDGYTGDQILKPQTKGMYLPLSAKNYGDSVAVCQTKLPPADLWK